MPLPTPETYEMLRQSIEKYLIDQPPKMYADLPRIISTAEKRIFVAIAKMPVTQNCVT